MRPARSVPHADGLLLPSRLTTISFLPAVTQRRTFATPFRFPSFGHRFMSRLVACTLHARPFRFVGFGAWTDVALISLPVPIAGYGSNLTLTRIRLHI